MGGRLDFHWIIFECLSKYYINKQANSLKQYDVTESGFTFTLLCPQNVLSHREELSMDNSMRHSPFVIARLDVNSLISQIDYVSYLDDGHEWRSEYFTYSLGNEIFVL